MIFIFSLASKSAIYAFSTKYRFMSTISCHVEYEQKYIYMDFIANFPTKLNLQITTYFDDINCQSCVNEIFPFFVNVTPKEGEHF